MCSPGAAPALKWCCGSAQPCPCPDPPSAQACPAPGHTPSMSCASTWARAEGQQLPGSAGRLQWVPGAAGLSVPAVCLGRLLSPTLQGPDVSELAVTSGSAAARMLLCRGSWSGSLRYRIVSCWADGFPSPCSTHSPVLPSAPQSVYIGCGEEVWWGGCCSLHRGNSGLLLAASPTRCVLITHFYQLGSHLPP